MKEGATVAQRIVLDLSNDTYLGYLVKDAVEIASQHGHSMSDLAATLGVSPNEIASWKMGNGVATRESLAALMAGLTQLARGLGRQNDERRRLIYFARHFRDYAGMDDVTWLLATTPPLGVESFVANLDRAIAIAEASENKERLENTRSWWQGWTQDHHDASPEDGREALIAWVRQRALWVAERVTRVRIISEPVLLSDEEDETPYAMRVDSYVVGEVDDREVVRNILPVRPQWVVRALPVWVGWATKGERVGRIEDGRLRFEDEGDICLDIDVRNLFGHALAEVPSVDKGIEWLTVQGAPEEVINTWINQG